MTLGLLNLTVIELVIVVLIGIVVIAAPVIGILLALRVFNEFQTRRRSDVVDQALTRDEEIARLPAADEPAGSERRP
jgi:hypothetical protein